MTDPTRPAIPGVKPALIERVKNILMKPKDEWAVIDAEPATVQGLYTGYAMLLAAIPAVAALIGFSVFGFGPVWGLTVAVSSYIGSLLGVGVLGLVIEYLAPNFGGVKNREQAFKVAIYAMTASWIAGVLNIFPPISGLAAIGGLYGLYLLYLGLPRLMKAPEDKALTYTIVVIVVAIVVNILVSAILGAVLAFGRVGI